MNHSPVNIALVPGFMLDEALWKQLTGCLPIEHKIFHCPLGEEQTLKEISQKAIASLPNQFVLIGFSLGGYVARQIAADHPDRVQALILIASSLREDSVQQTASKQHAIKATSATTFKGLSGRTIAHSLHPKNTDDKAMVADIQMMGQRLGYKALVTQSAISRTGVNNDAITCPTLIIASTHDKLRSLNEAHELTSSIANSTLITLDKSGHMIPLEQPQELARVITHWLSQHTLANSQ
ncbi:MAG: alpha/beta fold hydrolase [Pontibacterium sp.]